MDNSCPNPKIQCLETEERWDRTEFTDWLGLLIYNAYIYILIVNGHIHKSREL